MELMAAAAVSCGKWLVQAEPASFICLFFMTGEAEFSLGAYQKSCTLGLMRLVTGVAVLPVGRLVAAAGWLVYIPVMAGEAEGFIVVFKLEFTGSSVTVVA